jgi:hypothetical protein
MAPGKTNAPSPWPQRVGALLLLAVLYILRGDAAGAGLRGLVGGTGAPSGGPSSSSRDDDPGPPRPKMFMAVAAHYVPARLKYLVMMLEEFISRYPSYDFDIRVDTMSPDLETALLPLLPSPLPRGKRIRVVYTDVQDMGGDPYLLPSIHRGYMARLLEEGPAAAGFPVEERRGGGGAAASSSSSSSSAPYSFFWFIEDDLLVPQSVFQRYTQRYRALWEHGWVYSFLRTEVHPSAPTRPVNPDLPEQLVDTPVYDDGEGNLYARVYNPYHAFWVLDRDQFESIVTDPSRVWQTGFPPFDIRARMAVGFLFKYTGSGPGEYGASGWVNRAATPLLRDPKTGLLQADPACFVAHLPSNYAKEELMTGKVGSVPMDALFKWKGDGGGGGGGGGKGAGPKGPEPRPLPDIP